MSEAELSLAGSASAFGFGGGLKADLLSDGPKVFSISPSGDLGPSRESSQSVRKSRGGGKVGVRVGALINVGVEVDLNRMPNSTLQPESRGQRCVSMAVGLGPVCSP